MESHFEPKNKNNWAFIAYDYNKRKVESKQLAEKIKQVWDKNDK